MARRHPHIVGLLCGICAALPFLPLLKPGYYPFDVDILGYTMPIRAVAAEALANGHFPLWDSSAQCGQSLSGNPASAIFYPLFWLTLAGGGWGGFIAFSLIHYLLLGWAAYIFFAIGLRCRPRAAVLGALMISCSGYAYSMFYVSQHSTLSWMLFAATAWIFGVRNGRADASILAGGCLAMAFLSGFLQHVIIGLGALLIGTLALRKPALRFCGVRTIVLAGITAFSICLIPMQQILRGHGDSVRAAGIQYETASRWSTHPMRSLELAMPYSWGVPHPGEPYAGASVRRARGDHHHIDWAPSIFVGSAFLFLLLIPVRRYRRRLTMGIWLLSGGALYMAMGKHAPVHEALLTALPPLQIFRYPEKWLAWFTIGLATLSALKLEAYRPRFRWRPLILPALALVGLWLITAILPMDQLDPRIVERNRMSIRVFVCLCVVAALVPRRLLPYVLLLALLVETQRANHMRPPGMIMPDPLTHTTPLLEIIPEDARVHRKEGDIEHAPALHTPEGAALRKIHLLERAAPALHGLRSTSGLHPNQTARYTMLQEVLARQPWKFPLVASAGYVSLPLNDAGDQPAARDEPFGTALVHLPDAPPRIRLLTKAYFAESQPAALNLLEELPGDAFIDGAVIQSLTPAGPGELRTSQDRAGLLQAQVRCAGPTILYIGECLAPGWRAWVNGQPTPILPANLAFMAIPLPPGEHHVELRYCWH